MNNIKNRNIKKIYVNLTEVQVHYFDNFIHFCAVFGCCLNTNNIIHPEEMLEIT